MSYAALPSNLPPRLLNREAAAAYVNVSPGTFDRMIAEGRMPKARKLSENRIAWDRQEIDLYIDRLAHVGETVNPIHIAPHDDDATWRS